MSDLIERLDKIAANRGLPSEDRADLSEAASTLQAYEKALRAADELAEGVISFCGPQQEAREYLAARAALKGDTDA